jgi:hypothetical protein
MYSTLLDDPDYTRSSDELLTFYSGDDDTDYPVRGPSQQQSRKRNCCGTVIYTPNTSRFKNNTHSRILQRFPFLIEMFYWIINYAFYRMTSITSQRIFAKTGIWSVAQTHGIAVLETEQFSAISFLFPIPERSVQQWFMHGHQDFLTVLNKCYALIHIPGTVGYVPTPSPFYHISSPFHPLLVHH